MNESAASTTLKRIALFKVNKVPYLLEFNINWAAATHLTRVWSRWDELGKQAVGQTTVRKGRGNSTVSKSIFSTYTIILGIHTYIFHNRECGFFFFFNLGGGGGGTTLGWGGTCPPPGYTPMLWTLHMKLLGLCRDSKTSWVNPVTLYSLIYRQVNLLNISNLKHDPAKCNSLENAFVKKNI